MNGRSIAKKINLFEGKEKETNHQRKYTLGYAPTLYTIHSFIVLWSGWPAILDTTIKNECSAYEAKRKKNYDMAQTCPWPVDVEKDYIFYLYLALPLLTSLFSFILHGSDMDTKKQDHSHYTPN